MAIDGWDSERSHSIGHAKTPVREESAAVAHEVLGGIQVTRETILHSEKRQGDTSPSGVDAPGK